MVYHVFPWAISIKGALMTQQDLTRPDLVVLLSSVVIALLIFLPRHETTDRSWFAACVNIF